MSTDKRAASVSETSVQRWFRVSKMGWGEYVTSDEWYIHLVYADGPLGLAR